MNGLFLDIRRLWRDESVPLSSQPLGSAGMFADDIGWLARFGLHKIDSLAANECLFLLGRPGAGKSVEIERVKRGEITAFRSEWIVLIRCKEAGLDLYPEIVRDPEWTAGFQQPKPVRLVLDGLDEGFLREPAYFSRLKRTLEIVRSEHPSLRLLLTCRPAEWDPEFGSSIHELWRGVGKPAVFALEPLSEESRRALVEHWNGQDANEFFRWVGRNRFDEFAAWPRSLKWLAEQFKEGRQENLSYTELCRLRVARSFGEDKRLIEARPSARTEACSRAVMLIAATLVFCGRKGIVLDDSEPDCLTLDEMFRSADRLELPGSEPLTREDVREAVTTSHLIEWVRGYRRFKNQSDLEFLAGAMLASLDIEQLGELLGGPDHEKRWRVFPQLATTAANLAAQSPHFFEYLLAYDPRVLMRVDFASKSNDARQAAVEAMLDATAKTGATGGHDQHAHFSTLCHPRINAQLRPWLFDRETSQIVRELAFDIACECCCTDLLMEFERAAAEGDDFAGSKLPLVVRLFGKSWPEDRLRTQAANPDEDLASAALYALLEKGWTLRKIAPLLREPQREFAGVYFLFERLSRECTAEDIPAALAVFVNWPDSALTYGPVRDLVFALVSKGVTALDRSEIRKALTTFLISRFEKGDWLLQEVGSRCGLDDAQRRRSLLLALAEAWPVDSRPRLFEFNYRLHREDFGWLLDEIMVAKGTSGLILAKYAADLAWQFDETLREPLERAYAVSSELRGLLPVADEAGIFATLQRLRTESEAKHQSQLKRIQAEGTRPSFSHAKILANALRECRAGRFDAWPHLCFALSQPKSEYDGGTFFRKTDPRYLIGWIAATDELRAEMIAFAREFLLRFNKHLSERNSVPWEFFGFTYALSLHADRLLEDVELRAAIRPVWALALLRHPGSDDGALVKLLRGLTAVAPSMVADSCRGEFRERWERNESIHGEMITAAWCDETERALAEVLIVSPLQPETYMSGLDLINRYNDGLAREVATRRLDEHIAKMPHGVAWRGVVAACLFVVPSLWEKAWPHLLADRTAAPQLLLEYSRWLSYHQCAQGIAKMNVELVAALYGLFIEAFPLQQPPRRDDGHQVGPLDEVYRIRGYLQRSLEDRGEHAKLSSIYQRCNETRVAWWTPISIDRAKDIAHEGLRKPASAEDFIRFLATEGGAFVCDNDSLQRAVLASLRRFQKSLKPHGLHAIWEENEPRREEDLQIEIARHLKSEFERKRIVVNMETKVLTERTDIRVEAGPYAVTLEVKLGHSKDPERPLRKAMRLQLRSYLENQHETHGIYVVGWFFCPAFRPGALSDLQTLRAARRYFEMQAERLSTSGFVLASSVIDCRWPEAIASRARRRTAVKRC